MSPTSGVLQRRAPRLDGARLALWLAFGLVLLTVTVGLGWDRRWHARHVFDGFWSPPHLFIYGTSLGTALLAAGLTLAPSWRARFGPPLRLPGLPCAVPGALAILDAGLALLALAALLDNAWHSAFGLDETAWSTPHALLGWAWLTIFLGFVACWLALRGLRPVSAWAAVPLALLALGFSLKPVLGPLDGVHAAEKARVFVASPLVRAQPALQHTLRIESAWRLARDNPLAVPLGALWAGAALGLVRALDRRPAVALATATTWTLLTGLRQYAVEQRLSQALGLALTLAAWLPLPLLPATAALLLLRRLRAPEAWAWGLAGLSYGACAVAVWGPPLPAVLVMAAGGAMLMGGLAGGWAGCQLLHPTRRGVLTLALAALAAPCLTGMADLDLRHVTP